MICPGCREERSKAENCGLWILTDDFVLAVGKKEERQGVVVYGYWLVICPGYRKDGRERGLRTKSGDLVWLWKEGRETGGCGLWTKSGDLIWLWKRGRETGGCGLLTKSGDLAWLWKEGRETGSCGLWTRSGDLVWLWKEGRETGSCDLWTKSGDSAWL